MNSHDTRVLPVSTSRNRDMIDQDTRLSEPIQLRGSEFQDSGFLLLKIDLGFHQLEILEKWQAGGQVGSKESITTYALRKLKGIQAGM